MNLIEPSKNAPCPCGSGKIYRKCCGRGAAPSSAARPAASHKLDMKLVTRLLRFAREELKTRWRPRREFPWETDLDSPQMLAFVPWALFRLEVDGRPAVAWYMEAHGTALSPEERCWLEAQSKAWLSFWEVTAATPGVGVEARDLLTGENRFVQEVLASKLLVKGDAILTRVVDFENCSVFAGMFPRPLPPEVSKSVVETAREAFEVRSGSISVDRLREPDADFTLVEIWEEAIEELSRRPLPKLQNTDGEAMLMTTDTFRMNARSVAEVDRRLSALDGAQRDEDGAGGVTVTFTRPGNRMNPSWPNTVIGMAKLKEDALLLETNSLKRADALRGLVEGTCPGLLEHEGRRHMDPPQMLKEHRSAGPPVAFSSSPEAHKALREFKKKHYESWAAEAIPALGGLTPEQAARRPKDRERLLQLLKGMEYREQRQPEPERYDFSILREQLGLL